MAWNGFPGTSMRATGWAAGCVHSAALICGDPVQAAADHPSDHHMMAATRHPRSLWISAMHAAIRMPTTAELQIDRPPRQTVLRGSQHSADGAAMAGVSRSEASKHAN